MTTYGKIQKSPRRIGGKKTEYGYKLLNEHTYAFCTNEFAKALEPRAPVTIRCALDRRDFNYGITSMVLAIGKVITVFEQYPSSYKEAQIYQILIDGQLMWALIADSWFEMRIITHISGV